MSALLTLFDGEAGPNGVAAIKTKIAIGAEDVGILVTGDSTGDQTSEWPYLLAQWLAARHPTHTVEYRLFSFPGNAYGATTTVSTGSGARKIIVHNASVGSTQPMTIAGDRFAAAISAVAPDLMIISHGHNLSSTVQLVLDTEYCSLLEMMLLVHPGVSSAFFLQNPNRDDDSMDSKVAEIRALAADRGDLELFSAYDKFIALGKAASLYNDSQHPSPSGQQLFLSAITEKWLAAGSATKSPAAWLATTGTNLLANGTFSAFSGALPDSWTSVGGTISKDTIVVDGASSWSVKVETTGAASGIRQVFTGAGIAPFLGKTVSLAVRQRRATGASPDAKVGRIRIQTAGGASPISVVTHDHSSTYSGGCDNAFFWNVLRGVTIPSDATSLTIYLYCNPAASTAQTAWFDRAILVEGRFPRNV